MATHLHNVFPLKAGAEIYITCGTKVLMFKRGADAPMFPGTWVGPGGHVDSDEDFLKAAIREVLEETGISVSTSQIQLKAIAIHRRPNRSETWILPVFLTDIPNQQQVTNSNEGTASWLEKEDILSMENAFPSAKYYFDHVLNNKPGILYTNLVWKDGELLEEASVTLDKNY